MTTAITLKTKQPGQRACDQKDAKGELCLGHLKRWYTPDPEALKQVGRNVEIYRCERCHTLYKAADTDDSTAGQRYKERAVTPWGAFVNKIRKKSA